MQLAAHAPAFCVQHLPPPPPASPPHRPECRHALSTPPGVFAGSYVVCTSASNIYSIPGIYYWYVIPDILRVRLVFLPRSPPHIFPSPSAKDSLPYPTLLHPTPPYPTLPCPTLSNPTLPYPTPPCPTLPYPRTWTPSASVGKRARNTAPTRALPHPTAISSNSSSTETPPRLLGQGGEELDERGPAMRSCLCMIGPCRMVSLARPRKASPVLLCRPRLLIRRRCCRRPPHRLLSPIAPLLLAMLLRTVVRWREG